MPQHSLNGPPTKTPQASQTRRSSGPPRSTHSHSPRARARTLFTITLTVGSALYGCSIPNPNYDLDVHNEATTLPAAGDSDTQSLEGSGLAPDDSTTSGPETGSGAAGGSDSGTTGQSEGGRDDTGPQVVGSSSGGDEMETDELNVRRVFLSSQLYTGDLGGIDGADGRCQTLADAASLGGSWLAFAFDADNGFETYPQEGGPFVKLNGEVVAEDWPDLVDGTIDSPIDITEYGFFVNGYVWTGLVETVGATIDNSCYGWTSNTGTCFDGSLIECGIVGSSSETGSLWDGFYARNCSQSSHLYCIEAP